MLITSKHLQGACQDQTNLFNKTFPVGAEFNKTNWDLALSVGLQVNWMKRFLDAPACKIYYETIELASKIYKEATAPAWKIYIEATEASWKIFNGAMVPAWNIFREVTVSDLKIYKEAVEFGLFNALEQQFNTKEIT